MVQKINKVSLNFKEVKSSISDYKFFVARMGFNIEFIARKDYCYAKMKENDRKEREKCKYLFFYFVRLRIIS